MDDFQHTPYSGALFSTCGHYRYFLWRTISQTGPSLNIIGLNPSQADATYNDPTIRRCIGFAREQGFATLYVTNLFAYRATHPKDLKSFAQPIGPDNDAWLQRIAHRCDQLLFAWGNHGQFQMRDQEVLPHLGLGHCLGLTQTGAPRHPLYVKSGTPFLPYSPSV